VAHGLPLTRRPGPAWRYWAGLSLGLGLLATLVSGLALQGWLPPEACDWQPGQFLAEPWRAWTAALLQWSPMHWAANLAGCAVLAWLGRSADLGCRWALAWLLAWPLTQLGLLLRPDLAHYAGLSGVLHAGVCIAALALMLERRRRPERAIGLLIGLGLLSKVLLEHPLGAALRPMPGWDIAMAPFAHLSGVGAGVVSGGLAWAVTIRAPGAA